MVLWINEIDEMEGNRGYQPDSLRL